MKTGSIIDRSLEFFVTAPLLAIMIVLGARQNFEISDRLEWMAILWVVIDMVVFVVWLFRQIPQ